MRVMEQSPYAIRMRASMALIHVQDQSKVEVKLRRMNSATQDLNQRDVHESAYEREEEDE